MFDHIHIDSIQSGDNYTYTLPADINITTGYAVHLALSSSAQAYDFPFTNRILTIDATSTGTIVSGIYYATLYETDTINRNMIVKTIVNVYPNYTAIATKSKNEIRLELLETEITRRETGGDASYSAANVSITKIAYADLCRERDKLQEFVWAEQKRKARSLGFKTKAPLSFRY
jgi:hypothetical protein